jgi:hypothetical protein
MKTIEIIVHAATGACSIGEVNYLANGLAESASGPTRLFCRWDLLSAIQSIGDAVRQRRYFNLKFRLTHYPQRFVLSFFMQTGLVLRS